MKLKDVLNEYASKFPTYAGTWGPIGYKATPGNKVDPVSQGADEYIEDQLIDQAIDFIYRDYPELDQKRKIKRHLIQMAVGKIMQGQVKDRISMERVIKRLKKKLKVEVV